MAHAPPIYVEIPIRGAMDELWSKTQTPELHQRWDLRFSEISYLPRPDPAQPQRFLYVTRIGLGLRIAGEGESVGSSEGASGRASALRFWSDDGHSLIRAGSGYWKYVPADGAIRFLTRYDYQVRFGRMGAVCDRWVFRPLLGWATAWSFDRLRLWIERGIPPERSLRAAAVHAVARVALASTWIAHGVAAAWHGRSSGLVAGAQCVLGLLTLLAWRSRAMLALQATAAIGLGAFELVRASSDAEHRFDAALSCFALLALTACAWFSGRDLPSASRCRRKSGEGGA